MTLCFIVFGFFLLPLPLLAQESPIQPVSPTEIIDLSEEIDLTHVMGLLEQLDREIQDSLPELSLTQIFNDIKKGTINLSPQNIGNSIFHGIVKEVVANAPLIAKLLALAVLCAVINQLQVAFTGSVSNIARLFGFLVLLSLAIMSFKIALDIGIGAIERMVGFMQATLPVMYTLLLAMGNITSTALFKPIVLGSLVFLASIIQNLVLTLFFLSIILKLFNSISQQFKLAKLASLLEFGGKLCLGIVMTVFIGIMTIQGVTGGVTDGIALRTAKYSADLIPVVGKFFKDAVELVVSSGLLLKSSLGIVSLLAIIIITLSPIVKIIAMMFTFKISAALVEPLGENELADTLQEMAKGLLLIFVAVSSVALMFFMAITIIVGTGSLPIMLR
ncbi:MAG: stage III sporulation protein AE [Peptococcaceae bacterium]|nr:stage III sporulation protein AE [Peptococcaceae bacterium]